MNQLFGDLPAPTVRTGVFTTSLSKALDILLAVLRAPVAAAKRLSGSATAPDQVSAKDAMYAAGAELLRRTRKAKQPLTMVAFELCDLPQLSTRFGTPAAGQVLAAVDLKFKRLAARKGWSGRTDPAVLTLLLPGVDSRQALAATYAALGHPFRTELEVDGDERVVVPEFCVRTVELKSEPIEDAYVSLREEIQEARRIEDLRRRHLEPSKRPARHPTPHISKPCLPVSPVVRELHYPFIPATMPMPIGLR